MGRTVTPVMYDLETQSACDLKLEGGRRYAAHPSTRILCAAFSWDTWRMLWVPGADVTLPCWGFAAQAGLYLRGTELLPAEIAELVLAGREFVAHTGDEFDHLVWREKLRPVPYRFGDTIHGARAAGLPAKLDDLGKRLLGRGKDPGHSIMLKLCKLDYVGGQWVNKHQLPGNVAAVAKYCLEDVKLLERVYAEVGGYGHLATIAANRIVNERGVAFDAALAAALLEIGREHAASAVKQIGEISGLPESALRSVHQMKGWLKRQGVNVDNLQKKTVERLLASPEEFMDLLDERGDDDGKPE